VKETSQVCIVNLLFNARVNEVS